MSIDLFITGGTFDKEYNELKGELYFNNTHIHEVLKQGRSKANVSIRTLMMLDSLEMDDQDRDIIAENCAKTNSDRILITHGTDTMEKTARFLADKVSNKTIVLTGAMVPYAFGSSDGLFNLGSALACAQTLPPGIYIAMNGQIFSWDNVRKNRQLGEFETIK